MNSKKDEEITSGKPFTLFPILIAHSNNPSKREANSSQFSHRKKHILS
jgi:hypothetical protein